MDLLQLHEAVREETDGMLPIYWLGCSMGGAVACRAAQIDPDSGVSGMVMLAPMVSLDKVSQTSVAGPVKNKHLAPIVPMSGSKCRCSHSCTHTHTLTLTPRRAALYP